jgi:hypothetical protein
MDLPGRDCTADLPGWDAAVRSNGGTGLAPRRRAYILINPHNDGKDGSDNFPPAPARLHVWPAVEDLRPEPVRRGSAVGESGDQAVPTARRGHSSPTSIIMLTLTPSAGRRILDDRGRGLPAGSLTWSARADGLICASANAALGHAVRVTNREEDVDVRPAHDDRHCPADAHGLRSGFTASLADGNPRAGALGLRRRLSTAGAAHGGTEYP